LCLFVIFVACATAQQYWTLYSSYTSKYVKVDPTSLQLLANEPSASSASAFTEGFPGGDSQDIVWLGNGQFVSNDGADGSNPNVANRGAATTWEDYLFLSRTAGTLIEVNVNGNVLEVQSDNTLRATGVNPYDRNNLNNVSITTVFTLAAPPTVTPTALSTISAGDLLILYSVSESAYVIVVSSSLKATGTDVATAAIFIVVTDGSNLGLKYTAPHGSVQSSGGGGSLIINGDNFGGWEELVFTAVPGATTGTYTITAEVNTNWVTVSAGGGSLSPTTTASGSPPSNTQFFVTTPAINV